MLCLFVSGLFPVSAYFRVALSVSDSCHCEIHTYLGALAGEVGAETLEDLIGSALSDADGMLCRPDHVVFLDELELGRGSAALRTLSGSLVTLMNVTTDSADVLCHFCFLHILI